MEEQKMKEFEKVRETITTFLAHTREVQESVEKEKLYNLLIEAIKLDKLLEEGIVVHLESKLRTLKKEEAEKVPMEEGVISEKATRFLDKDKGLVDKEGNVLMDKEKSLDMLGLKDISEMKEEDKK